MTRLTMAVVGVGHLGKEHARILAAMPEAELVGRAKASPGLVGRDLVKEVTCANGYDWTIADWRPGQWNDLPPEAEAPVIEYGHVETASRLPGKA